jgi:prevent-host-death family protein
MNTVGIRELKTHLSRYLRRVRAGNRLVITERGQPIASLEPIEPTAEVNWAYALVAAGRARWSGGKPRGLHPRVRIKGKKTVSDAVIEDRR